MVFALKEEALEMQAADRRVACDTVEVERDMAGIPAVARLESDIPG